MWRVEKDPFLASTFGAVTILDRAPDFDRLRSRMESAVHAVPRLGWRVQPNPTGLGSADLGRRSRLRHRPPRAPCRPARPWDATPAARPRQPVRARSARPHPPAVAVPRRRGSRRRQGGACSRRCTTRSPTGSTACACRCSTSTSPAMPRNRPADASDAPRGRRRRRRRPRSTRCSGYVHATFRLPISIARQVGELLADPASIPTAGSAAVDGIRGALDPAVGVGRGPLTVVDGSLDAAPRRGGAGALPVDAGGGQAARWLAQHGLPHRLRRGGSPLPRRSRAPRSTNCAPRWR